jgi:hypothetical protein
MPQVDGAVIDHFGAFVIGDLSGSAVPRTDDGGAKWRCAANDGDFGEIRKKNSSVISVQSSKLRSKFGVSIRNVEH